MMKRSAARQGARPARPDAEPEDRHRHLRRGEGGPEIKAGKVEFRVDKTGIVHAPVGKVSFAAEKLIENARRWSRASSRPSRRRPRASI
jgi:hypothetical protein